MWLAFLVALFVAALAWRIAYLTRLAHSSLAGTLTADSLIYWGWAGSIRQHGIVGANPFFLGPLYPYILALLRTILGDVTDRILVVQAIWGSLAVVLLADAARRVAGGISGVVIGVVLCFYEMAVFFDGLVLMESLLFFLEAVLLWWIACTRWDVASARRFFVAGLLVGLLAEGRATAALLLIPVVIALVPWAQRPRWRTSLFATLSGFALVVLPVAVRNFTVSREWIPFTYNLGYNLYVGNNPEARGATVPIAGANVGTPYSDSDGGGEIDGRAYLRTTEGLALTPAQSSRYWTQRAARYIVAHPFRTLALAFGKLSMYWSHREYAQIENVRQFRAIAGPIGAPFIGRFVFLGVLAFVGLWFTSRERPAARFAMGYVLITSLTVTPFFVADRYRIHLIPGAALLAAVAIEHLAGVARHSNRLDVARTALALLAGTILVYLPVPHLDAVASAWVQARDRGDRWLDEGRPDSAVAAFEQAVALERRGPVDLGGDMANRVAQAQLHFRFASALRAAGRRGEMLPWLEKAAQEDRTHPALLRALGDAYASMTMTHRADSLYARLDSLPGGVGLSSTSRGWQAARAGQLRLAERYFRSAIERAPRLWEAWGALIRVETQLGNSNEAAFLLRQARAAGLPRPALRAHEALLAAARGDVSAAAKALAQVPPSALRSDPTLADIARIVRGFLIEPSEAP